MATVTVYPYHYVLVFLSSAGLARYGEHRIFNPGIEDSILGEAVFQVESDGHLSLILCEISWTLAENLTITYLLSRKADYQKKDVKLA